MGGRGSGIFSPVHISLTGVHNTGGAVSPLITAGLTELRGNEADPESTLRRIDKVRFNSLTHEQLFVVDRDGFVLEGYDGNKGSVSFPIEKAAAWKDCIVTHRHPDEFGGTFSFADISCIAHYGWQEHEASANEGRYNIQRTRQADGAGLMQRMKMDAGNIEREMRKVAQELGKKRYTNRDQFLYDNRKKQLRVVETWYEQNLPKYGFTYTFTPREKYGTEND